MDDALRTIDIKHLNIETWLLFTPLFKISGYAPAFDALIINNLYRFV